MFIKGNQCVNFRILIPIFLALFIFLSLVNQPSSTAVATESLRIRRGSELKITATLHSTFEDNVSLSGQKILFYDETNNVLLGYNFTDKNGQATYLWEIPIDYNLGLITINATYAGNSTAFYLGSSTRTTIDIYSPIFFTYNVTDSTGNPDDHIVAPGETVFISLKAYDDLLNAISNLTVVLYDDHSLFIKEVKTDDKGIATFSLSIPQIEDTELKISLESNASPIFYDNCKESITIHVRHIYSKIDNFRINNIEGDKREYYYPTDILIISGILKDEYNSPIGNSFIYLKNDNDDILLINKTNGDGIFFFTFNLSSFYSKKLGEIKLSIFYPGNNAIVECSYYFSVFIKKSVKYSIIYPKNDTEVIVGDMVNIVLNFSGIEQYIPLNCQLIVLGNDELIYTLFVSNSSMVNFSLIIPPPNGVLYLTFYLTSNSSVNVTNFYNFLNNHTTLILLRYEHPILSLFIENELNFYAIGDYVLFRISVKASKPIAYNQILIYVGNASEKEIFKGKTDSFGSLIVQIKLDEQYFTFFQGTNNTTIQFTVISCKNLSYFITESKQIIPLKITKKYRTYITFNIINNNGSLITVNAMLKLSLNKTGVINKPLDIFVNKTKIEAITNENGSFTFNIRHNSLIRKVVITAYFNGDDILTYSSNSTEIYGNLTAYIAAVKSNTSSSNPFSIANPGIYFAIVTVFLLLVIKFKRFRAKRVRQLKIPLFEKGKYIFVW